MKTKLLFLMLFVSAFSFAEISWTLGDYHLNVNGLSIQEKEFTISPNPSKSKLNIKLPSAVEVDIEVFDVLGKRVYKGQLTQLESSINVSNWKSGVYLVRISNDKTSQTKRFIKG